MLFISLTLTPSLFAAVQFPLRWRWSNPAPHGNNIVDMAFSTNLNRAVQVAEQGQVYTSDDLSFWIPRASGTTDALRAVTFFNDRIIITGENGRVLYADSVDEFLPGTLVDGTTSDWLEAVAASSTLLVAVGDGGSIYTSSNGQTWKRQNSTVTDWLRGVAYGAGTFVAVGEDGRVVTSPNGTNWTRRTSNTSVHLNRVAYSPGRFTAVGNGGVVIASVNNGQNWNSENCGALSNLFHTSANSGRLVLGDEQVRLHENGIWSNQLATASAPPIWTYFSSLARPNFFLVAGQTGMIVEGYKTNSSPYFWIPSKDSVRHWLFDLTYAGNIYVAAGDRATIMTSGNGIDWSLELVPQSVTNRTFFGVGGTTNLLIAVGEAGTVIVSPNTLTSVLVTNIVGTNVVVTNEVISTLGVVWHAIEPRPTTADLQGVTFANNLYIVTGGNGTILTSPNGTTWTLQSSPVHELLSSVAATAKRFVAVGDNGSLLSSDNGTNWINLSYATTNWFYRVRYLGGRFIVTGENGTLLLSNDGLNWTPAMSGTSSWLNDVVLIDDTYFIVGNQGTVLSSTNCLSWVNRGTITRKSLTAAATDSAQLVLVGLEGIILRSPAIPDVTPVQILGYSRVPLVDGVFTQNVFLFGGQPDQCFVLDYRSSLETNRWIPGPNLEFLDSSGTLYYIEKIPVTNAPPVEFYRSTLSP